MKGSHRQSYVARYLMVGLLAWLLALIYTMRTVRQVRSASSRNVARQSSCAQLAPETARLQHHILTAGRLIELAEAGVDFEMAAWLAQNFSDLPQPQIEVRTEPDAARWSRRIFRVRWHSLPLDSFARIVTATEQQVPPVRLVGVTIDPHSASGAADIGATFITTGSLP